MHAPLKGVILHKYEARMTKKSNQQDNQRTALIIDRDTFEANLNEQLLIGKELANVKVNTVHELEEFEKNINLWNAYNKELLKSSFNNLNNSYYLEYEHAGMMIGFVEVSRGADINNPKYRLDKLNELVIAKINTIVSLISRIKLIHAIENNYGGKTSGYDQNEVNSDKVFVIHGHDEEMKRSVQLFLTRANLTDIVLHEQLDKNQTIIEKLIEVGSTVSYAIALLSPDDIQADGTFRARQNVILEIGYFMGKLGRERLRLLVKENVVIPTDLQGILYDNYNSSGTWQIKLLREMKDVGIPIDIDSVINKF